MTDLIPAGQDLVAPSAARVALADDTPTIEELFTFAREAELRVQTLRMTIEDRVVNAKGAQTVTYEVQLKHPGHARVMTRRGAEPLSRDYDIWLSDGETATTYQAAGNVASVRRLPERVAGIDLMMRMLEQAQARGHRVYCLGATNEVLVAAVARMRELYPDVAIVGQHHGYFGSEAEAEVAAQIGAVRPDILLVAMTSPKKERFLSRWSGELGIAVCHGVGGSFDVLAGKVRRAPRLWQRLGHLWPRARVPGAGRLSGAAPAFDQG